MQYLDKPTIIRIAACHTCCASPGEPCTFARKDDPRNLRARAMHSHLDRIQRARRLNAEANPSFDSLAAQLRL